MYRLIFVFFFIISIGTFAQNDSLRNDVAGMYLTLPIDFPSIDNSTINNELNLQGFPSVDYSKANYGIGLQVYVNRWLINFAFNKKTRKTNNDFYALEVEYRSTTLNVGYDVIKTYWISLYPYAGFKGSGLNYLYRSNVENPATFQSYFQTTLEYKEITNSRMNFDLGLGFSVNSFLLFNVRGGYLLPLEKSRWKINNNKDEIENSPTLKYNYYINITLGIGSIISDEAMRRRYNR